jgi:hypothetical protein
MARRAMQPARSGRPATVAPPPAMREMTVIAQDPGVRVNGAILTAKISVPAENLVAGPIGYRVQVVDYDSSTGRFNGAHRLPAAYAAEPRAWRAGRDRMVGDFRFHAQNVYALVMRTLARFEFALGRRVGWSFQTHQLKVAPHGMVDANAFYSPGEEGLVFGYFPGKRGDTIYTCLSHDVVVHETSHALIDALRERYLDPSSPDQAAFHEGLADVIALLSVFSQQEVLQALLLGQRTMPGSSQLLHRDDLTVKALRESALFGLAKQMGREVQGARGDALRHSARLKPRAGLLQDPEFLEPHRRGEVLVAAVMNAFIEAWAARIRSMGVSGQERYPAGRVAEEGADIAEVLTTMWIRALDYMPPVHMEFPDALSAVLTADLEVWPDDTRFQVREHLRLAFARYGIKPARTSRADGAWKPAPTNLRYDRVRFESMRTDKDEMFRFIWENRRALQVREGAYTRVLSLRPCTRIGPDGFTVRETVAEYYQVARLTAAEIADKGIALPREYAAALAKQRRDALARRQGAMASVDAQEAADQEARGPGMDLEEQHALTPLYGGGVLIFDEYGRLKYHVHNDAFGAAQGQRLRHLWESGQLEARQEGARLRVERLSVIHRLRGIDARRFPLEGW